jgi:hypothetical protein
VPVATDPVSSLERQAERTLAANDRGGHTAPSSVHYPHQWLWDSAYVAIGLSHLDPRRAAREIESLLTAQWANGMVPHMVFGGRRGRLDFDLGRLLWSRRLSPDAPPAVRTSGITQPPVVAEAVWRVGTALGSEERAEFFRRSLPRLINYHTWFYRERDPTGDGLVISIHPWETGMDNTPPWMHYTREHEDSRLAASVRRPRVRWLLRRVRGDARAAEELQRIALDDGLRAIGAAMRLRRWRYGTDGPPSRDIPWIQDAAVNSILIRGNAIVRQIADDLGATVPEQLELSMRRAVAALAYLWDDERGLFFSRDAQTGRLLRSPTIASLMPLYTDALSSSVFARLSAQLQSGAMFDAPYPVPSVPIGGDDFRETNYWSGPTWVNMNWNLIDGLKRRQNSGLADALATRTIEMVQQGGIREYFSPLSGRGLGMPDFSWTAALVIDLIRRRG